MSLGQGPLLGFHTLLRQEQLSQDSSTVLKWMLGLPKGAVWHLRDLERGDREAWVMGLEDGNPGLGEPEL